MTDTVTDDITIRRATADDIAGIVAMLADDELGAARENPADQGPYRAAFAVIDADPQQCLVVAARDGELIGTAQLTYIAGLARQGGTRAQIEAVRISEAARGSGLGSQLIAWCVDRAREHGCLLVQLTSDVSRLDAHRFYEKLGFEATHIGFKLILR
ncbi:GNAT family N-acetyltransferase [Streptomyces sp. SL13]|jgi:GNAT superfamily N-acetyltransferase|uniref:GNAT family N-acetyltransferase n=1 Tax=Streptantibioticus silvisoli TaxID=2705255 RepID=A0AA90H309_9ACTN|nr:GNAT family N-acetyltransferase [Streptantibioticus silvisoli]MDI5963831.1 GNAT family N-acetyltransferase [Streptantibioticus silvisoli]MDI5970381.1 GNAT family N-acetyltransferase [Streptantibioticus silvisoli]